MPLPPQAVSTSRHHPQLRPKGWFARNWKWFIPLTAVACLGLFCTFIAGILFFVTSMMKNSEPFNDSLQTASQSPEIIEALGEPIEPGLLVLGSISLSNNDGEVEINYSISGPRDEARVFVKGSKSDGVWTYEKTACILPNGKMLLLSKSAEDKETED